jgi:hypothetical protein
MIVMVPAAIFAAVVLLYGLANGFREADWRGPLSDDRLSPAQRRERHAWKEYAETMAGSPRKGGAQI